MGRQNKAQNWSQYFCDCLCTPTLVNNDLLPRAAWHVQPPQSQWFDTDVRCLGFPLQPVSPDKWNLCQDWDLFLFFALCSVCWNCCLLCCETSSPCASRTPGTRWRTWAGCRCLSCIPRWDTSQRSRITLCNCQLPGGFLKVTVKIFRLF